MLFRCKIKMLIMKVLIILILTRYCYCASIDYIGREDEDRVERYDNYDDDLSDHVETTTMIARKAFDAGGDEPFGDLVVVRPFEVVYDSDNETKFTDFFSPKTTDVFDRKNTSYGHRNTTATDYKNLTDTEDTSDSTPYINPRKVLNDYNYDYDIESSLMTVERFSAKKVPHKLSLSPLRIKNKNKSSSQSENVNELYNLRPVVDQLDFNEKHHPHSRKDNWFVVEDHPCWELPMIYGEIDRSKSKDKQYPKMTKVFQMFPKYLKNVVRNKTVSEPVVKEDLFQFNVNKWCRLPPCYGDHTMCLFPSKDPANFCNRGYYVTLPHVSEQTAFLFTLNSMRNAIASGDRSHHHPHIPNVIGATNMKKVLYDYELQMMAERWLLQCLPGPAICGSLDNAFVTQLECTKTMEHCCIEKHLISKCSPRPECFVKPLIGCLHEWFWNTGQPIQLKHIMCGFIEPDTYSTVQLLWAKTSKVGCAYGTLRNGDIRVICNFAPGAPFNLQIKYYCGIINQADNRKLLPEGNITDLEYLAALGFVLQPRKINIRTQAKSLRTSSAGTTKARRRTTTTDKSWGVVALQRIYQEGFGRRVSFYSTNVTKATIARLVTRYKFKENSLARCDSDESIFDIGVPASKCKEVGARHDALCYDFRDVVPGYRMIALLASIPLFTLILYDLFTTSMKQSTQ